MTDDSDLTGTGDAQRDDGGSADFAHPQHESGWVSADGAPMVPWLAVYGRGPESEDVVKLIRDTCAARGVRAVLRTLEEALTISLKGYMGLVLVLPSAPPPSGQEHNWKGFQQLADDFRARRISAAEAFRRKSDSWQEVGVLQVVYTEDALSDPNVLALITEACASHRFGGDVPFASDLFAIYQPGAAQITTNDQVAAALADNWRRLRPWGIDSAHRAFTIKRATDWRRDELDQDTKKPAMHRPIPGIDMNRLDLVLFKSSALPPIDPDSTEEERKNTLEKFRANGARVVRDLRTDLERDYPWFHRPTDKAGRRDAQTDFVAMYKLLRVVVSHS